MKIDGIRYFELWVLLAGVFNTWYFLADIPQNFDELDESDDYPKGLKIFTQFVLLPLVSIYLLILYAYIGRILIQWSWPVGWVSYLVIGFSTLGDFFIADCFPVQEKEENRWIKNFSRSFFLRSFSTCSYAVSCYLEKSFRIWYYRKPLLYHCSHTMALLYCPVFFSEKIPEHHPYPGITLHTGFYDFLWPLGRFLCFTKKPGSSVRDFARKI